MHAAVCGSPSTAWVFQVHLQSAGWFYRFTRVHGSSRVWGLDVQGGLQGRGLDILHRKTLTTFFATYRLPFRELAAKPPAHARQSQFPNFLEPTKRSFCVDPRPLTA